MVAPVPEVPQVQPDVAADADILAPVAWWVRRPDSRGRMGWQFPESPEYVAWDDLPLPGPACPVCGSLESWTDALGRTRCGVCEAGILDKALLLADKAGKLRTKTQNQKPAPQDSRGSVSAGSVDTKHLGSNRPLRRQIRGLCAVTS